MSTRAEQDRLATLQVTLDLLIRRTPVWAPQHCQRIARAMQRTSDNELLDEHGALYPALQRLESKGWITAELGTSENNRGSGFCTLTKACHKRLTREAKRRRRWAAAIGRMFGPEPVEA